MLFYFICAAAHAEYRAFELSIVNPSTGEDKTVISTLDPNQYRRYYPVAAEAQVTYKSTWRCSGNTSNHQPVCPRPEGQN